MRSLSDQPRQSLLGLITVQALAGDALLRVGPWGVNLVVWALIGTAGVAVVCARDQRSLPRSTWIWLGIAVICAASLAGRAADRLGFLSVVAGIACLTLAAWTARGGNPLRGTVAAYAAEGLTTGLHSAAGGLAWLRLRPAAPPVPPTESTRRPWVRIGLGLLAAVPLLVVFGSLFAAADPVFDQGLRALVTLDLPTLMRHVVVMGFWGWITAGYSNRLLPSTLPSKPEDRMLQPPRRSLHFEVLTCLILLSALFLAFVLVQLRYLFGDDTLVRETAGLTYAEYARKGFFELVGVAGLLLPVLLLADWLLTNHAPKKAFRLVSGILLLLLAIIMASACKRLALYVDAYGWTETRWYASAMLVWLATIAVALATTVLRGRRESFAGVAFLSGLLVLGGLQVSNPDARIARHNLRRAAAGQPFDTQHALQLGPDAVPELVAGIGILTEEDQTKLKAALVKRWAATQPGDWRTWNFGRSRARRAVATLLPQVVP